MREILFRGKKIKDGKWFEGDLFQNKISSFIRATNDELHYTHEKVIPETVGQYTGLTDKNGKKIFEGDIISCFINYLGKRINGVVEYNVILASYMWQPKEKESLFLMDVLGKKGSVEIIGNIHDNPELLKGE